MDGRMDGWVGGWESQVKDCLQQSKIKVGSTWIVFSVQQGSEANPNKKDNVEARLPF